MTTRAKWHHDTLILGDAVVGTVTEMPSGEWFACGCLDDWEDIDLGSFGDQQAAKKAVQRWVETVAE